MELWKATDPPSSVSRTPNTSTERREQYLTYLLVSIVAVFLFCNSLKFFLVFYDKFLDVGAMNIIEILYLIIQVKQTLRNLECSDLGIKPRYFLIMFARYLLHIKLHTYPIKHKD